MALIKKITLDSGVDAEYWRITRIVCNYAEVNTVRAEVSLYLNKRSRNTGKSPVKMLSFELPVDSNITDARTACYTALAQLDDFSGSLSDANEAPVP